MPLIKICGITNKSDAIAVSGLDVDMIGFIFHKGSKRYIDPVVARDIIGKLPSDIFKVGVFVDLKEQDVLSIADDIDLDVIQLHGSEAPDYCERLKAKYKIIKAFRLQGSEDLKSINSYDADYYLLDTFNPDLAGGTGEAFDWNIIKNFEFTKPFILSGGLNPDNVGRAVETVVPYGVDTSSGVERSPGVKDISKVKQFVEEVRRVL